MPQTVALQEQEACCKCGVALPDFKGVHQISQETAVFERWCTECYLAHIPRCKMCGQAVNKQASRC